MESVEVADSNGQSNDHGYSEDGHSVGHGFLKRGFPVYHGVRGRHVDETLNAAG